MTKKLKEAMLKFALETSRAANRLTVQLPDNIDEEEFGFVVQLDIVEKGAARLYFDMTGSWPDEEESESGVYWNPRRWL